MLVNELCEYQDAHYNDTSYTFPLARSNFIYTDLDLLKPLYWPKQRVDMCHIQHNNNTLHSSKI